MNQENPNSLFMAVFNCYSKNDNLPNCLGYYSIELIQKDERGEQCYPRIFGAWVYINERRVTFSPDHGDPPSVRAGSALDLHQGASARVRADAKALKKPVVFYIDDAGKIAAMSADRFTAERVPAVLAASPILASSPDLYHLARSGVAVTRPAPAL